MVLTSILETIISALYFQKRASGHNYSAEKRNMKHLEARPLKFEKEKYLKRRKKKSGVDLLGKGISGE